jgi:hypothetical protein
MPNVILPSQEKRKLEDYYFPPENIREEIFGVYEKYLKWKALRDAPYRQFNHQTLLQWLEESRRKFWGYIPLSVDSDTPQFFFPETRNQIISILAKIANLKLKPSFEGVEGYDILTATILKDLFEYWKRSSNRKIQNFWQFLYSIINGTIVVFTAYLSQKKKVKNIKFHDPETGITEYEEEELDESDVEEIIVNLEDFYIPKLWEPDIQKQNQVIWRTLMKWSDFEQEFGKFEEFKYVMPGYQFADDSIFSQFISFDVRTDAFVEVIRYFNSLKDQYMIIANGVLLNPIKRKGNRYEISPLPWNHKKLPFSKTIFEPLDANWFYGMSLPQKVKSPQEALNKMWELLLDREQRAVAAPIITTDPAVESGIEFKAGRIYQVQAPVDQYREISMSPASASYWNALQALHGIVQSTGSSSTFTTLTSRQPRSATENSYIREQKQEAIGLVTLFYQDLLEQKVWLILQNMIQFYTAQRVEKTLGKKKFHKILSLTDVKLFGGGVGNRELRITPTPSTAEELQQEALLRSLTRKEKVEIIEVSPEKLRSLKFDIKITFETENSPEAERLIFLDYITTIINLFGQAVNSQGVPLISLKKMLFRVAEKFGENVYDIIEDPSFAEYEEERFGIPMEGRTPVLPASIPPATNQFNQRFRGMMFGAEGPGERMRRSGITDENILRKF